MSCGSQKHISEGASLFMFGFHVLTLAMYVGGHLHAFRKFLFKCLAMFLPSPRRTAAAVKSPN
eukprot:7006229-Pyramimonas_sp.AAC.1